MAKPSKRTARRQGRHKRIAVLLELRVPRHSPPAAVWSIAATIKAPGFWLDRAFQPVPVKPSPRHRARLEAAAQEIRVVRGTIDADKMRTLRGRGPILAMWRDANVAPFGPRRPTRRARGRAARRRMAEPCPIPPCDCTVGNPAIGTIADVARYLGVDQIWAAGYRGQGIVIGIVDGGIAAIGRPTKPGETPRIRGVVGGWPEDDWGTTTGGWKEHGNMTATDALGMAPEAHLYDIRISGGSSIGDMLGKAVQGYEWAILRHRKDGTPHVLSNSWGLYAKSWEPDYATNPDHVFTRKVEEAMDEGILVLFSAGNCGDTCPVERCKKDVGPKKSIWGANGHPRVMSVGAVNLRGEWIGYSSQGPGALDRAKPDFCSISHFAGYSPGTFPGRPSDTGTSSANAIAAGVVALFKQKKPALTQEQAKQALKITARDIGPAGWDQHSGAGIICAQAALASLP